MIRLVTIVAACTAVAVTSWRLSGEMMIERGPAPAYDHQIAQHLASLMVPAKLESYFMFDLNELGNARKQAEQLAEALSVAQRERQYIGLTGENASHIRAVLQRSRALAGDAPYDAATLIVVAPPRHRDMLTETAAPLGTEIAYVAYP